MSSNIDNFWTWRDAISANFRKALFADSITLWLLLELLPLTSERLFFAVRSRVVTSTTLVARSLCQVRSRVATSTTLVARSPC